MDVALKMLKTRTAIQLINLNTALGLDNDWTNKVGQEMSKPRKT